MARPLYVPVKIELTVTTPEVMKELLSFCESKGIFHSEVPTEAFAPLVLDTQMRKPTATFKDLAGHAWLTQKGMINTRGVFDFLVFYAKIHKLRQGDGAILLNDELRETFNVTYTKVYEPDLASMAHKAFVEG